VHAGLRAVLHPVVAGRRLAPAAGADPGDTVGAARAALAVGAVAAASAAVDVRLVAVAHLIRAGGRLAGGRRAGDALADPGGAVVADAAGGVDCARRAVAAAIDVGLVAVVHAIGAVG